MALLPRGIAATLLALGAGCAAPPSTMPDGSPMQRFELHGPGYSREMTFDGTTLANPSTDLQRFPDGIRGRISGVTVFLHTKPGEVNGVIGGGAPVDLKVEASEPGTLKANGLWAGRPCRLELTPTSFTLTFATCGYELEPSVGANNLFHGRTACWSGLGDRIELAVPKAALAAPPEERAVWLVAFLSR